MAYTEDVITEKRPSRELKKKETSRWCAPHGFLIVQRGEENTETEAGLVIPASLQTDESETVRVLSGQPIGTLSGAQTGFVVVRRGSLVPLPSSKVFSVSIEDVLAIETKVFA